MQLHTVLNQAEYIEHYSLTDTKIISRYKFQL